MASQGVQEMAERELSNVSPEAENAGPFRQRRHR